MIEEQNINQLPKDWKWVKLGEAVQVLDNLRKPINSSERQKRIASKSEKELFPYYGATGQVGWIDSFITNGEYVLVGEDGAPFLDIYKEKAYKIKGRTWVNNHAHILQEIQNVSTNNFILHYLNSINYRPYVNGTTRLKLTKGSLVDIPFPLPPLPTQAAIVAKIEELFSELDKGIEQLKTAQQQLKTYRLSVLKWAFEGKLTNENVKDGELPEGWKNVILKDMSESIQYGYTESSSKEIVGPKFLRITDIQENKVDWEEVPYCKIEEKLKAKYLLKDGDLVFARTGATVGKSFLIKGEIPEAVFASYLIRVRVNKEMNEKYLSYFFYSNNYWSQITEGQVGIGQPNVNGTKLGQLNLVVAPIEEQNQIVQEIESRLSVADKMEESITQSLQQAAALRQSILKKAFEGALV